MAGKGFGLWALGCVLLPATLGAQQQMTLQRAVELAQKQGHAATAATATRDAARARERSFSMGRLPQLSLSGTAPRYEKTIVPVTQPDGSTIFTPVQSTTAQGDLTLAQPLALTGGTFSVTSSLQRYELTNAGAKTLRFTSSPVTFALQQPIFRPNALRWDSRTQDVTLDAAEQAYLEEREGVAISATSAFFDLYIAKRQLDNAELNVGRNDTLYIINKARLEIGKIGENDLLQSELTLLRSRSAAENARLNYQRALAAFRLAINVPGSAPIDVVTPDSVPMFEADTTLAVAQALQNRAQIKGIELQALTARRRIAEARLAGGPGATVNASLGFNQTGAEFGSVYDDPLQARRFNMFVSIPLITWGSRGANIQAAKVDQRRVEATARMAREQVIQEAHFAALQLALARRNLDVGAKADTVAQKRYEVAYNRYVIGKILVDNLFVAQNEKDQAFTEYLNSLRGYWQAYYRLRQLTLYDFERKQPIR